MSPRPVLLAAVVDVAVVLLLQSLVLALPIVSAPVGALVGAGVLVALVRPVGRDAMLAAAGVGVLGAFASLAGLAAQGVPVLSPTYLVGWVVTLVVSGAVGAGVVWTVGRTARPGLR